MSTTSKNRNLLVIIAVLLLTNVGVLAYFLWYKKPAEISAHGSGQQRDRNGMADVLQKEVGFDEGQLTKYKELRDRQRDIIRPMFDSMRVAKDGLFKLISTPAVGDSTIEAAADVIAQRQRELDIKTFQHFKRVRNLCRPDQEAKYDSLLLRMFRRMGNKPKSEGDKTNK
ncbi:MAG: hypothetical protein QM781_20450 [Chitinophagaceae bacterium]